MVRLCSSATGAALLSRAQGQGTARRDARNADLLKLASALAWASEQAPEDEDLLDRLFALVTFA